MSDKLDNQPADVRDTRPPIPEYDPFKMRNNFDPYGGSKRDIGNDRKPPTPLPASQF